VKEKERLSGNRGCSSQPGLRYAQHQEHVKGCLCNGD